MSDGGACVDGVVVVLLVVILSFFSSSSSKDFFGQKGGKGLDKGQCFWQELEVGQRTGPYLLISSKMENFLLLVPNLYQDW